MRSIQQDGTSHINVGVHDTPTGAGKMKVYVLEYQDTSETNLWGCILVADTLEIAMRGVGRWLQVEPSWYKADGQDQWYCYLGRGEVSRYRIVAQEIVSE